LSNEDVTSFAQYTARKTFKKKKKRIRKRIEEGDHLNGTASHWHPPSPVIVNPMLLVDFNMMAISLTLEPAERRTITARKHLKYSSWSHPFGRGWHRLRNPNNKVIQALGS
jgi:hypothetical protein